LKIKYFLFLFLISLSLLASCSKTTQGAGEKLLETVINSGDRIIKLEYDSEDRIVKCYKYSSDELTETLALIYSDGKLTHIERTLNNDNNQIYFSIEENRVLLRGIGMQITLFINDEGFIYKKLEVDQQNNIEAAFQYENGNLVKKTAVNRQKDVYGNINTIETIDEYKYDSKSSPFNCNTPRWFLHYIFGDYAGNNNVVSLSGNNDYKYEYDFNTSGFPVNKTLIIEHEGVTEYDTTYFFYRGETAVPKMPSVINRNNKSSFHDSQETVSSTRTGANGNRFNNFISLFEFIIKSENINEQIFENDEVLLNNTSVSRINYEANGDFTVFSNDINIIVYNLGSFYQINKIIINPNSKYLNMFPYNNRNDYLSNVDIGVKEVITDDKISYSYLQFNSIWRREYFIVHLYFDRNGFLYNAEIGFPMG